MDVRIGAAGKVKGGVRDGFRGVRSRSGSRVSISVSMSVLLRRKLRVGRGSGRVGRKSIDLAACWAIQFEVSGFATNNTKTILETMISFFGRQRTSSISVDIVNIHHFWLRSWSR